MIEVLLVLFCMGTDIYLYFHVAMMEYEGWQLWIALIAITAHLVWATGYTFRLFRREMK